jgi:hypothetical protein
MHNENCLSEASFFIGGRGLCFIQEVLKRGGFSFFFTAKKDREGSYSGFGFYD